MILTERDGKMSEGRSITRKDIAREAGVSISVVSRALNNSGYVEKEKKKRIIDIANQYGYIPNPIAMALQQKKTHQLLFFCGDLTGTYYNQMYHGMARAAEKRGYYVQAIVTRKHFDMVKTILTDGILFPSERTAIEYAKTVGKNYHLPTVTASFDASYIFEKPMPCVIIDNYKVVNLAIDYLMHNGHTRIGMALPFNSGHANQRFKHWRERMTLEIGEECLRCLLDVKGELKMPRESEHDDLDDFYCEDEGFSYYSLFFAGKMAARLYAEARYKPSAVICFNDDMALGMVGELLRLGIRVPQDVSVMGIDGIFTRNYYAPKLTTVGTYPERQGAKCAEILIDMLEGRKYKYMNYSPYKILEGETVLKIRY